MKDETTNPNELLSYQQSLLNLVTQGSTVVPEPKGPAVEPARQLDALVRQFRNKAS